MRRSILCFSSSIYRLPIDGTSNSSLYILATPDLLLRIYETPSFSSFFTIISARRLIPYYSSRPRNAQPWTFHVHTVQHLYASKSSTRNSHKVHKAMLPKRRTQARISRKNALLRTCCPTSYWIIQSEQQSIAASFYWFLRQEPVQIGSQASFYLQQGPVTSEIIGYFERAHRHISTCHRPSNQRADWLTCSFLFTTVPGRPST